MAALLVGSTISLPVGAQTTDVRSRTQQIVDSARFARSQGNCRRFAENISLLRVRSGLDSFYQILTPDQQREAAEALRQLLAEGCPRGQPLPQTLAERDDNSDYSWTGFYLGGNVGYASGNNDLVNPNGVVFGFQGGYGVAWGGVVFGVDAILNFASTSGSRTEAGVTEKQSHDVTMAFLARLGIMSNGILFYAAAGVYLAKTEFSISGAGFHEAESKWIKGPAIGFGVELPIAQNLSAGARFLHAELKSETFFDGTVPIGPTTFNKVDLYFNYRWGSR